jgi:hypothetical protein
MARVVARLLDQSEHLIGTVHVESDETYTLNGYFRAPDGGTYLICELKSGRPPTDTELTAIWIVGPRSDRHVG